MPPWQSANLTRQQAIHLYCRGRDPKGGLVAYGVPRPRRTRTHREDFLAFWRARGAFPGHVLDAMWAEEQQRQAALQKQTVGERKRSRERRK